MSKTIILIHGKKRSGKDYIGSMIEEWLLKKNHSVLKFAFADPMKDILACTLGVDIEDLNNYKNLEEPIIINDKEVTTCRKIFTSFGNDIMKNYFGINVWANIASLKIKESKEEFIIITDLRVLEEYKVIEDMTDRHGWNLLTFNIISDIISTDTHITEQGLDIKFNTNIDNRGYSFTKYDTDIMMSLFE